jgi:uncharacterized protein (TIGR03435 family)
MTRGLILAFLAGFVANSGISVLRAAGQALSFDVASVKLSPPITPEAVQSGSMHTGIKVTKGQVDIGNDTLLDLIGRAYGVKPYQIRALPWMAPRATAQSFDILAKLPEGSSEADVPEMLRNLLVERFKSAVHKETAPVSVYALVVGKDGIKMKTSETVDRAAGASGDAAAQTGTAAVSIQRSARASELVQSGTRLKVSLSGDGGSVHYQIEHAAMSYIVEALAKMADRSIVDQTGLSGYYDLAFDVSTLELQRIALAAGSITAIPDTSGQATDPDGSLTGIVQRLGLKLESRKVPLSIIVVDKAEPMPTVN